MHILYCCKQVYPGLTNSVDPNQLASLKKPADQDLYCNFAFDINIININSIKMVIQKLAVKIE